MGLAVDMIHLPGATGFDTNQNCTGAADELAAFGFRFGVRYVCQENTQTVRKIIRKPEYDALKAAGVEVWLVSEWYTPSDSPSGTPSPFRYGRDLASLHRAADEDCEVAFRLAADCGHTGLILHAVDWDATGNRTAADMVLYLDRCLWNQLRTPHPFGIYCGGRMLRYLIDVHGWSADKVVWWQASAWSSKFPEPEAHVLQTSQFPVGGVTVDLNTVYRPIGGGTDIVVEKPILAEAEEDMIVFDTDGTKLVAIGNELWHLATDDDVTRELAAAGQTTPRALYEYQLARFYWAGPAPTYSDDWARFRLVPEVHCRQRDRTLPPPVVTPSEWAATLDVPSVPGKATFILKAG